MNLPTTSVQSFENDAAFPKESEFKFVSESVAEQAAKCPQALALASEYGALKYEELAARAAQLSSSLISFGIKPDGVVALCLPRSPAFVVAALAVLQAGAAYMPVSPSDPPHRRNFVLQDARADVVITTRPLADPGNPDAHVIYIDELGRMINDEIHRSATAPPRVSLSHSNLAYVIYTSGSTGQPKGVEITHAGLSNLIQWHNSNFQVTATDRATQLARLVFDAAVWEIWPYLAAGASLHLPPDRVLNDPEGLRDWLIQEQITISFVPTPMAERLLAISWPAGTPLRTLLTGGDALHRSPPADLPFALINNYGPTECAVVATSCLVRPGSSSGRMPAIGAPITNVRLHVLDRARNSVSVGTPGELYIGGPGVARGYRNRPDLTAERFVNNPANPSERLFKTGDLVQILPNAELAFLGRLDEQIKVRGFRVEPHEIIAALDAHPAIAQSFVIGQQMDDGERRLVAYLVIANGVDVTLGELHKFLKSRVPDYMVPTAFVKLDALPLTTNGKVDRSALPAADESNTWSDDIETAPESDLEKAVAGILAPLLKIQNVDVNANFFALGGHSLLGTQLIARLRDMFGVELPLRTVFECPTVAGLSAEIDRLLLAKLENMSDAEAEQLLLQSASHALRT